MEEKPIDFDTFVMTPWKSAFWDGMGDVERGVALLWSVFYWLVLVLLSPLIGLMWVVGRLTRL